MTRKLTCILAALVLLVMGMMAVANASTTFPFTVDTIDDFADYNQIFTGTSPIIENFHNDQINTPGLNITAYGVDQGIYTSGYYQNVVDVDTNSYQVVTFNTPMNGFGGLFDLANPGNPGTGLAIYTGSDPTTGTLVGSIPNTYAGDFWGVFFASPVTSVVIADLNDTTPVNGNTPYQETYQIPTWLSVPPSSPSPPALSCWAAACWVWWVSASGKIGLSLILPPQRFAAPGLPAGGFFLLLGAAMENQAPGDFPLINGGLWFTNEKRLFSRNFLKKDTP